MHQRMCCLDSLHKLVEIRFLRISYERMYTAVTVDKPIFIERSIAGFLCFCRKLKEGSNVTKNVLFGLFTNKSQTC